jgi:hypothetical protein
MPRALAKLAALMQIPLITTASVPDGPNGPLIPEIQEAAPHGRREFGPVRDAACE